MPVTATNAVGTLAILSLPHFGQAGLAVPCSEMLSIRSKVSPQSSQRYAYVGIATASLLAEEVSGSERQAGLAQTFQVLGAAVMAFVLAKVMARRGRRVGLATGYVTGSAGAVLVVVAGVVDSMPLLLLGAAMLGSSTAANSAAVDGIRTGSRSGSA